MILQMIQGLLLYRILYEKSGAMKCCSQDHLSLNGGFERRIWSNKGMTKIARLLLKRFANAKEWEEYWQYT